MKTQMKFIALAAALLATDHVFAQSAGTWMVRLGVATITPENPSGNLSAPGFNLSSSGAAAGGSKTSTGADTQLGGGITYMYTDNISVDVPFSLPFKHKLSGAGATQGVGQIGEVQALPFTVFLQYRFFESNSQFRPYVGLGATYAYFFNEQGSGTLTAMTNPGGPPTKIKVDSQFAPTPQLGATYAIDSKWFFDVFYSKTILTTTTTLSTGQKVDAALNPETFGVHLGYKF
jgi:outer membrane protein